MISYLDWKVGDRVVCVAAGKTPFAKGSVWAPGEALVEGEIYTLRSIHTCMGSVVVWLDEVQRSDFAIMRFGPDVGYGVERFRKVQPRKTDISIFEAILHGARVPEDA